MVSNRTPKLIVGLGNPGEEYKLTRHNVGVWFVHALARCYGAVMKADKKFHGDVAEIIVKGHKIRLLFPTTYMNLSGVAVRAMCDYYQIDSDQILVAHDELDLPVGVMRLKFSGGHGGHNGLRDTAQHVGKDYWRLRIGVDHPGNKKQVSNYLTKNKTPTKEEELILVGIEKTLNIFEYLLSDGYEKAMLKLHAKELTLEQLKEKEIKEKTAKEKKEKYLAAKKLASSNKDKSNPTSLKNSSGNSMANLSNKTALQLALEKAQNEEE